MPTIAHHPNADIEADPDVLVLPNTEAPLTREFSLDDLPWLPADEVAEVAPPPPPSSRGPAKPRDIVGGAAAADGGPSSPECVVTTPKRRAEKRARQPSIIAAAASSAPTSHYLGTTMPDLRHREAFDAAETPVEATGRSVAGSVSRVRFHQRPLVAAGAVALAAVTFTLGVGLFRPRRPDAAAAAPPPLPAFLELPGGVQPPAAATSSPSSTTNTSPIAPVEAPLLVEATPSVAPVAEPSEPVMLSAAEPPPAESGSLPSPTSPPAAAAVTLRDELAAAAAALATAASPPAPGPAAAADESRSAAPPGPSASTTPNSPEAAPEPPKRASGPVADAAPFAAPSAAAPATSPRPASKSAPRSETRRRTAEAAPAARAPSPELERAVPADAIVRRRTTYVYADSSTFAVATAPKRVTDIVLEPGEKLVTQPTAGDAALWSINVVDSVQRDQPQQHVYIRPLRAATSTNLTLATTRRNYHLELTSSPSGGNYMAAVDWRYPAEEAERKRRQRELDSYEHRTTTAIADVKSIAFHYAITVVSGEPSWKPTMVFDDGKRTFIRFPARVVPARSPVLMVLREGSLRSAQYVNYRITGDLYVVDRLIAGAELRLPNSDGSTDIVRISRRSPR